MTASPAPRRILAPDLRKSLADDILAGKLPPGTRLDERKLAAAWGMSRTPVREALKHLAATGLVESLPHRGVFVAAIDAEHVREMFELAGELEAACARLAALRMTPAERRKLEDMHLASRDWVAQGLRDRYDAFNLEFHAAVFDGCRNRQMVDAALAARARVAPYRRAQFNMPARIGASFQEHQALVEAVLRGDAEAAAACMRSHVAASLDASEQYRAALADDTIPAP